MQDPTKLDSGSTQGARPKGRDLFLLVMVLGLHLLVTAYYFPPHFLVDERTPLHGDYGLHYRTALLFRRFALRGRSWGYDPYTLCGYPANLIESVSNHGSGLFLLLFGRSHPAQAYKSWIVLNFVAFPLLVGGGAAALRLGPLRSICVTYLASLVLAVDSSFRLFREFGGFSFVSNVAICFLAASLLYRYVQGSNGAAVGGLAAAAAAFWCHGLGIVTLGVAVCALSVSNRGSRLRQRRIGAWCLSTIALLPSIWWLYPLLRHAVWKTDSSRLLSASWFPSFGQILLCRDGARFDSLLFWLGFAGYALESRRTRRPCFVLVVPAVVFSMLALSPLNQLPLVRQSQPRRFLLAAIVWLLPGVAIAVTAALARLTRPVAVLLAAGVVTIALPFQCLPWIQLFLHTPTRVASLEDKARALPAVQALERWAQSTPRGCRILFENHRERTPAAYGERIVGGILAVNGERSVLGNTGVARVAHQEVELTDGIWLGRELTRMRPAELDGVITRYAINWIVAIHPRTQQFLGMHRQMLIPVRSIGPFLLFRVRHPAPLADPSGEVHVFPRRIAVSGAGNPVTLLRFHWDPDIRTNPPLPIERDRIRGERVGLLRIRNGSVKNFVVELP